MMMMKMLLNYFNDGRSENDADANNLLSSEKLMMLMRMTMMVLTKMMLVKSEKITVFIMYFRFCLSVS